MKVHRAGSFGITDCGRHWVDHPGHRKTAAKTTGLPWSKHITCKSCLRRPRRAEGK